MAYTHKCADESCQCEIIMKSPKEREVKIMINKHLCLSCRKLLMLGEGKLYNKAISEGWEVA